MARRWRRRLQLLDPAELPQPSLDMAHAPQCSPRLPPGAVLEARRLESDGTAEWRSLRPFPWRDCCTVDTLVPRRAFSGFWCVCVDRRGLRHRCSTTATVRVTVRVTVTVAVAVTTRRRRSPRFCAWQQQRWRSYVPFGPARDAWQRPRRISRGARWRRPPRCHPPR